MSMYVTPLNEVEHNIGVLYELVIRNNLKLTDSVNNLRVTVRNLMAVETKVNDLIVAQELMESKAQVVEKQYQIK